MQPPKPDTKLKSITNLTETIYNFWHRPNSGRLPKIENPQKGVAMQPNKLKKPENFWAKFYKRKKDGFISDDNPNNNQCFCNMLQRGRT